MSWQMSNRYREDVTAAIINYGSSDDTAALIASLLPDVASIIVVDNSGDLPDDERFSSATIIRPRHNLGFGAATNRAAAQASTRWLLILNPDVRLTEGSLEQLVAASRELHAPLCGPRFYWDEDCTLQLPPALGHPLWLLSDRNLPHNSISAEPDITQLAMARHERFWKEQGTFTEPVLSGACLLVDNTWFRENRTAIFDEAFFLYYEDTDLCGRLMRKGIMPVCVADASAVHFWNQSSEPPEGKAVLMKASEKIFLDRYYPNGAPPLPLSKNTPAFTDLGSMLESPVLDVPPGCLKIDLGVQEDFIVFVRARNPGPTFKFNTPMWQRIRPGTYYMRAVDAQGNARAHWRWMKPEQPENQA